MARLLEMLHIPRENLYCVGDNQNDIPMMALSAIPFAPANCAQEVKDWGRPSCVTATTASSATSWTGWTGSIRTNIEI